MPRHNAAKAATAPAQLPRQMLEAKNWLLHKNKKPFYVNGTMRSGTLDSDADRAQLATYSDAVAALAANPSFTGLGFAITPGWQFIDLDHCRDPATGKPTSPEVKQILLDARNLGAYIESSISGTGFHGIGRGKPGGFPSRKKDNIETYGGGRYMALGKALSTGHDELPDLRGLPGLQAHFEGAKKTPAKPQVPRDGFMAAAAWHGDRARARELLPALNPDSDYPEWIKIGMALHTASNGHPEGLEVWETWSRPGKKFVEGDCAQKWNGFKPGGGVAMGTLVMMCQEAIERNAKLAEAAKQADVQPRLEPPIYEPTTILQPEEAYRALALDPGNKAAQIAFGDAIAYFGGNTDEEMRRLAALKIDGARDYSAQLELARDGRVRKSWTWQHAADKVRRYADDAGDHERAMNNLGQILIRHTADELKPLLEQLMARSGMTKEQLNNFYRQAMREASPSATTAKHAVESPPTSMDQVRDLIVNRRKRTAAQMRHIEPLEFYVGDLVIANLAGGFVSKGGVGKTSILISLGIATALGIPWMGFPVKQGSFALLSLDDAQEDLDAALAYQVLAMNYTDEQCELVNKHLVLISLRTVDGALSFAMTDAKNTVTSTGLDKVLAEALASVPDLRCVALDTLRQFAGGTTNDDRVMTLSTKAVTRIADARKCAAIVPHHGTKAGGRDGTSDQHAGSGSAAFGDNLRFLWTVQVVEVEEVTKNLNLGPSELFAIKTADRGSLLRLDDTRGSLLRKPVPPTYIRRAGHQFFRVNGANKSTSEKLADASIEILRAVHAGATSNTAVRKEVKGNQNATTAAITALVAQGLLKRGPNDRGVLMTPAGLAHLNGEPVGADPFEEMPTTPVHVLRANGGWMTAKQIHEKEVGTLDHIKRTLAQRANAGEVEVRTTSGHPTTYRAK